MDMIYFLLISLSGLLGSTCLAGLMLRLAGSSEARRLREEVEVLRLRAQLRDLRAQETFDADPAKAARPTALEGAQK